MTSSHKNSSSSSSTIDRLTSKTVMSPEKEGVVLASTASSAHSGSSDGDSEYTKEVPFEVFKTNCIELCRNIGFEIPFEVARLQGGSYNRIIGITIPEHKPTDYILRTCQGNDDRYQSSDVKDQVALLQYLAPHLPVAKIYAFDSSQNNALSATYVLQERLPGSSTWDDYHKLPLSEKLQITELVAEAMKRMEQVKFDSPGRLAAAEDFPELSHKPFSVEDPVQIKGIRRNRYQAGSDMPVTGHMHVVEFLQALLEIRKAEDEEFMAEKWSNLQKIASQMRSAGLTRATDNQSVLWHWDFFPRNIMLAKRPSVEASESSKSVDLRHSSSNAKNCHHQANIVMDNSTNGAKHSINITLETPSNQPCQHHVQITVEDSAGTTYTHTMDITHKNKDTALSKPARKSDIRSPTVSACEEWYIPGILDWDLISSVPLILTRFPPLWLWCDEDNRSTGAEYWNPDIPQRRALTDEELLIKAYFDRIMEKHDSSYADDAYRRGPWLRSLASFALYGFGDATCWDRYKTLQKDWKQYYDQVKKSEGPTLIVADDDGADDKASYGQRSELEEDEEMDSDEEETDIEGEEATDGDKGEEAGEHPEGDGEGEKSEKVVPR